MTDRRSDQESLPATHAEEAAGPATAHEGSTQGAASALGPAMMQRKLMRRLMRKGQSEGQASGGAMQAVDAAASSSGSALPEATRGKMESAMGADFSAVRLHTGGASEQAAHAVEAQAYTEGKDIHFGAGQFAPGTRQGDQLIAHELAHVAQQGGGVQRKASGDSALEVSQPHEAAEVEADATADRVVAHLHDGAAAPGAVSGQAAGGTLHRKEKAGAAAPAADHEPTDAQVAAAMSWATAKGGPGLEAVRSIQETLGVAKTGIYDAATAKAVFKKQGEHKQAADGKAGPAFCASVGVIYTQKIDAATVKDEDVKYLKENCKDGVTVAIYTKFNTAKTGNGNLEFMRKADEFAKRFHAVGLNGGSVSIGKSSPLTDVSQVISIVQAIHKGLLAKAHAAAPAGADAQATDGAKDAEKDAAWTKVKHLAFFTHGMEYGIATDPNKHTFRDGLHKDSSGLQPSNIKSFVSGISDAITKDVSVELFACSTGHDDAGKANDGDVLPSQGEKKGANSFAGSLAKELSAQGADESHVYGHTQAKHTTENSAAREFSGAGGGEQMFDVLYTDQVIRDKCAKYVPTFATDSEADQKGYHDRMRGQMWLQYRDSIETELLRANKGQKQRFPIDMGMEMFQAPDSARAMLLEDFDKYWMKIPANLNAVLHAPAAKPTKPTAKPATVASNTHQ